MCLGEGEDVSGNYKDIHACSIVLMLWNLIMACKGCAASCLGLGFKANLHGVRIGTDFRLQRSQSRKTYPPNVLQEGRALVQRVAFIKG